ncbi:transcription elongation factor Elf1 like-domain-containing protein [Lasiosphaeria miniovina]|uniref:Transcription elongation factor 1 homolog n=1 Tax=Lasiosphaeria miniovina TaxID=1954250 RepID=A0AA40B5H0_9PEZI|nr:transcription elongation factor Elf1 like-domain-containing protein [Lasiosphaeria miniovina]KAK0728007.1 transcription elongation factor Elf1 like-domain-containing protein [Lasiosphaeria miniovina]
MGKRKKSSRKPQGPRKNEPLATVFTCLFCNHEKSVSVKLDKKAGVGTLDCKTCSQKFQCGINYLSAAVDVYSEWVDAAGEHFIPTAESVWYIWRIYLLIIPRCCCPWTGRGVTIRSQW